jgi:protein-tyrosine kinase
MEKIKRALEKAREGNRTKKTAINSAAGQARLIHNESQDIKYTTTRKISTNKAALRNKRVITGDTHDIVADQYKVLRTHILQRLKANGWSSLAITSPHEGCGKTLTSVNLAISLAREVNHSVLLVDLDLRRPNIHKYFYEEERPGLSDYLVENVNLSEILFNPDMERLVVLPGNKPFANSSELLSSPKMLLLVDELKNRYPNRIVIYDVPPLLSCDDTIVFSPYVDAIMFVVEDGKTRKEELKRAYELMKNCNVIGAILNKSKHNAPDLRYY